MANLIRRLSQHEQINFLLTNRIPRRYLTCFMGWFSKIESPLLTRICIFLWKLFADDLDLSESKKQSFNSLHECFTRELQDGVRVINSNKNIITSPCDAIVGSCGKINGTTVYQAKGFPYELADLIPDKNLQKKYSDGVYVTLRLKSSMYHHFHAPVNCRVNQIDYISGETWNVNPIALKRIEKLYCKNERAVVDLKLDCDSKHILLVPVAAILVASMKFNCINHNLDLQYKGPRRLRCDARYKKGDNMGCFQHGSTIILFASENYRLHENIFTGQRIKMGQSLLVDS